MKHPTPLKESEKIRHEAEECDRRARAADKDGDTWDADKHRREAVELRRQARMYEEMGM